MAAFPKGKPGCPELARWIASIDKVRIVLTQSKSKSSIIFDLIPFEQQNPASC